MTARMAVQFTGLIEWQPGAVQFTGLIEWQPGWLSSWLVWLSDRKDGWFLGWLEIGSWRHWGPIICGVTARYGHLGPFNMRWVRQIWTLRSNFRLWDSNLRALRPKIWTRNARKSVLRSKNELLRGFPRLTWLIKYSGIFPGHSGLILYHFYIILNEI